MASWPEPTRSTAYPCRSRPFFSKRAIFAESSTIRIRICRHPSSFRPAWRPAASGRDRATGSAPPCAAAVALRLPRPVSSVHADERGDFQGSLDRLLFDDTEARGVDLLVDDLWFERRELKRCDHVVHHPKRELDGASPIDDPRGVFRLPRQELLTVGIRDLRVRQHDDARLTVVDPGQPGAGVVDMAPGEQI